MLDADLDSLLSAQAELYSIVTKELDPDNKNSIFDEPSTQAARSDKNMIDLEPAETSGEEMIRCIDKMKSLMECLDWDQELRKRLEEIEHWKFQEAEEFEKQKKFVRNARMFFADQNPKSVKSSEPSQIRLESQSTLPRESQQQQPDPEKSQGNRSRTNKSNLSRPSAPKNNASVRNSQNPTPPSQSQYTNPRSRKPSNHTAPYNKSSISRPDPSRNSNLNNSETPSRQYKYSKKSDQDLTQEINKALETKNSRVRSSRNPTQEDGVAHSVDAPNTHNLEVREPNPGSQIGTASQDYTPMSYQVDGYYINTNDISRGNPSTRDYQKIRTPEEAKRSHVSKNQPSQSKQEPPQSRDSRPYGRDRDQRSVQNREYHQRDQRVVNNSQNYNQNIYENTTNQRRDDYRNRDQSQSDPYSRNPQRKPYTSDIHPTTTRPSGYPTRHQQSSARFVDPSEISRPQRSYVDPTTTSQIPRTDQGYTDPTPRNRGPPTRQWGEGYTDYATEGRTGGNTPTRTPPRDKSTSNITSDLVNAYSMRDQPPPSSNPYTDSRNRYSDIDTTKAVRGAPIDGSQYNYYKDAPNNVDRRMVENHFKKGSNHPSVQNARNEAPPPRSQQQPPLINNNQNLGVPASTLSEVRPSESSLNEIYEVQLVNGGKIKMNRAEYMAYQLALGQMNLMKGTQGPEKFRDESNKDRPRSSHNDSRTEKNYQKRDERQDRKVKEKKKSKEELKQKEPKNEDRDRRRKESREKKYERSKDSVRKDSKNERKDKKEKSRSRSRSGSREKKKKDNAKKDKKQSTKRIESNPKKVSERKKSEKLPKAKNQKSKTNAAEKERKDSKEDHKASKEKIPSKKKDQPIRKRPMIRRKQSKVKDKDKNSSKNLKKSSKNEIAKPSKDKKKKKEPKFSERSNRGSEKQISQKNPEKKSNKELIEDSSHRGDKRKPSADRKNSVNESNPHIPSKKSQFNSSRRIGQDQKSNHSEGNEPAEGDSVQEFSEIGSDNRAPSNPLENDSEEKINKSSPNDQESDRDTDQPIVSDSYSFGAQPKKPKKPSKPKEKSRNSIHEVDESEDDEQPIDQEDESYSELTSHKSQEEEDQEQESLKTEPKESIKQTEGTEKSDSEPEDLRSVEDHNSEYRSDGSDERAKKSYKRSDSDQDEDSDIGEPEKSENPLLRKFRIAGFALGYYGFTKKDLEEKIKKKFTSASNYYENELESIITQTETKYKEILKESLSQIAQEPRYLDFTPSSGLDIDTKRENYYICLDYCTDIISELIKSTLSNIESDPIITLISFSCFEGCYYPNRFAYNAEYLRMIFGKYGTLKQMSSERSKMLIGGIIIIRVLILRVLLDIERQFIDIYNQFTRKNAILISSLIYHAFKEIIEQQFPILTEENSTVKGVLQSRRIYPRTTRSYARKLRSTKSSQLDLIRNQEMVEGMTPKDDLKIYYEDPEGVETIIEYVDKLVDNVYQFGLNQHQKRQNYKIIRRVLFRRKVQQRIKFLYPVYFERMRRWEEEILEKFNIEKDSLTELSSSLNH